MGWVLGKVQHQIEAFHKNQALFDLIARAENWLKQNYYTTPILKWKPKLGEIQPILVENNAKIPISFSVTKTVSLPLHIVHLWK